MIIKRNKKINQIQIIIMTLFVFTGWVKFAYANVIWPTLYVTDSHFRFWYIIIICILLEAIVLKRWTISSTKQALLVSLVVNVFSATVGFFLLSFVLVALDIIMNNLFSITTINNNNTIPSMLIGSILIETLVAKIIWKYPLKKTFLIFMLGNIISYGFIAIDLFIFGGWDRVL